MTSRADLFFIQYYQNFIALHVEKGSYLDVTIFQSKTWLRVTDYNGRNHMDPIQSLTVCMLSNIHQYLPLFEILIATFCNEMPVKFILGVLSA